MRSVRPVTACVLKNLAVLLIAAGPVAAPGHTSEAGEAAFKARCAACHGPRDVQYWGRQRPDAASRKAWMEQLLRRHHPPPTAELTPIIDYIQASIAASAAPR